MFAKYNKKIYIMKHSMATNCALNEIRQVTKLKFIVAYKLLQLGNLISLGN